MVSLLSELVSTGALSNWISAPAQIAPVRGFAHLQYQFRRTACPIWVRIRLSLAAFAIHDAPLCRPRRFHRCARIFVPLQWLQ